MSNQEKINKLLYRLDNLERGFCCKVDCCLGISNTGDESLFLNQQGNWVAGGLSSFIEVTKLQFTTLITNSQLEFPANYKITDVEEGLYITTLTNSTFDPKANLNIFLPVYTPSGSYKGQYHSSLGAVLNNEIYTWGEWNYRNDSGGNLTPDVPSANVFDTANRFTKLTKNSSNFYKLFSLDCNLDTNANIIKIINNSTSNVEKFALSTLFGVGYAGTAQTNVNSPFYNLQDNQCFSFLNNRFETNNAVNSGAQLNNGAQIYNNRIVGSTGGSDFVAISNNTTLAIYNNVGNIRITSNSTLSGVSHVSNNTCLTGYLDILACDFRDNSRLTGWNCTSTGKVYVWDVELHENINLDNWTFNIGTGETVYFKDSYLNANVDLVNWTYNNTAIINFTDGQNFKISNVTDVSFDNVQFMFPLDKPQVEFDFTGWTRNISNEHIIGERGYFSFTHDFSVNPLNAGDSVYYNFIPENSVGIRITSIVDSLSGGAGATLRLGIETDDNDYGFVATDITLLTDTSVSTLSNITTANRSLQLTAGVNNITSGTITVNFEFTFNNG